VQTPEKASAPTQQDAAEKQSSGANEAARQAALLVAAAQVCNGQMICSSGPLPPEQPLTQPA